MNPAPPRPRARQLFLLAAAALFACACLFALAAAQEAQSGAPPQHAETEGKDERKATVYGRAVYEGTNRPARRAEVTLLSNDRSAPEHTVLTDADGRFRIEGVPAGRYLAFVNQPGLLSPSGFVPAEELRAGIPDLFRPEMKGYFEEVEVSGKEDKEVTIYARRGAALGGKVAYANGDPAINLRVHIMRRSDKRLTKFLPSATAAALFDMTTDDRGRFRVAGLPPGEYVVGVSETADHKGDASDLADREQYDYQVILFLAAAPLLMTYHPSELRAEDARVVKVEAGDERDDVDITVVERELRTLSGVVRGRDDRRPVQNVTVLLARKAEGGKASPHELGYDGGSPTTVKTDAEGRWRLLDIPDGEYALHLTPPEDYEATGATTALSTNMNSNGSAPAETAPYTRPSPTRRKRRYAPARRELRVTADVTELSVELAEGARVSGNVVVEGGRVPDYSGIFLSPAAPDANVPAAHQMPSVTAFRGEFLIEGIAPGRYRLIPHQMLSPNDDDNGGRLYLKAITWNGRDLMREPLDIAEGARVEGVRVVYARDPARLRVRVLRPGERKPVAGTIVFLLLPDLSGWSVFYSRAPQCLTGADGSCEISAAPGDYAVVALPSARLGRAHDFEADLRRRAPAAPRLTLHAAETKTFELTLPEGN